MRVLPACLALLALIMTATAQLSPGEQEALNCFATTPVGPVVGCTPVDWMPTATCNTSTVVCGPSNYVEMLLFRQLTTLSQTIPEQIGDFPMLDELDIINSPLVSGTIPSTLGKLTNLEYLYLWGLPKVSGTIPSGFSNLVKLNTVSIRDSGALSGTIPIGLANMNVQFITILATGIRSLLTADQGICAAPALISCEIADAAICPHPASCNNCNLGTCPVTLAPTALPTFAPTASPSYTPSAAPTAAPTAYPLPQPISESSLVEENLPIILGVVIPVLAVICVVLVCYWRSVSRLEKRLKDTAQQVVEEKQRQSQRQSQMRQRESVQLLSPAPSLGLEDPNGFHQDYVDPAAVQLAISVDRQPQELGRFQG